MSASNGCGATTATHRQDGPYPVNLSEACKPLNTMFFVSRRWAERGDKRGDRGQGWLSGKGKFAYIRAVIRAASHWQQATGT
jgi:hypothetical protein